MTTDDKDRANSPKQSVEDYVKKVAAASADEVICVWQANPYKPGDRACIDLEWHMCSTHGTWIPTGQPCTG